MDAIILILKKYIGFQKYIPVSDCKNINFEEIHWFSEIYTSFGLQKISILKKSIGFRKYFPLSEYKNINFEEINGLSEIYTRLGLQKYQF